MLRLAAYARVSTEEQDTLQAQFKACNEYALRNDGTIVLQHSDKISGLDPKRPGYQRVLEAARAGEIDGVVVWKMSRFGRDHGESIRAALELERLGIRVYSVSEPTDSPFVRDLMLLIANNDSRVISQNVKLGMRAAASKGLWMNTAPPGYRVVRDAEGRNPHLILDDQALLVRQLFAAAASGRYSTSQLRDYARDIGFKTSKGRDLGRSSIHVLLTNPVYMGDVVYGRSSEGRFQKYRREPESNWIVSRDAHPAIVDRETFAAVGKAFAAHRQVQAGVRGSVYLLTGLLRCGHCGSRMFGSGHHNEHGYQIVYRCVRGENYGDCALKAIGGQAIETFVRDHLRRIVVTPDVRRLAEEMTLEREKERQTEASAQRRNLLRSRQTIEDERLNLARELIGERGHLIPADVYARLEAEKVEALRIVDRTLATLDDAPSLDVSTELAMLEGIDWDAFDAEAWRQAAALLIEKVTARKGTKRGQPAVEVMWTPVADAILAATSVFA